MIAFLIYVIVLLLIFGVIWYVIDLLPITPPNFKQIIKAIVGLILVLILLGMLFGGIPMPVLRGVP